MIQSITPDAVRGRVIGVYTLHTNGGMASFNMITGTLAGATALTASFILGAGGILFALVMIISFVRVPLRQLYANGLPTAAPAVAGASGNN